MIRALFCLLLIFFNTQAYTQVQKWVEPDGRIIYSDRSPSDTAQPVRANLTPNLSSDRTSVKQTGNQAGKIELVEGKVQILSSNQIPRIPQIGHTVQEGDSIITGQDGEIHINMEDGGYLAVRPNTQLKVEQYQAQGNSKDKSIFNLLKGSFRSVTGWIGRYNSKNYAVHTITATIGIRGTDHEPLVIIPDDKSGEAGTYDKVNSGETYIENTLGRIQLKPNQAGFVAYEGNVRPKLLKNIPPFFRKTRHEHLFNNKHELILEKLKQYRQEKRKAFQERPIEKMREKQQDREEQRRELRQRQEQRFQRNEERKRSEPRNKN